MRKASMKKKDKVRLPAHIKPERYQIMLKPELNEFTFTGEETIDLILEKPTKKITLHSAELEIDSAEFIHGNKEVWAGKIAYDTKTETATFAFPKLIQKGKGQLKLVFKGILNDKMRGFYRSKYGENKYLATTQFESTDARRAFPCFDEPAQKAIFDVTLMVPTGTTAISNTVESIITEHESGFQVVKFASTPKMSTYLLAFIVGEFEYIEKETRDGIKVRVFTTLGKKKQAKFALDVAVKSLEFYNDYFGIKYPLPILDMIAIPDFAAGAMENWGAVTYRESTLLIDEAQSSTANKQWVALVIAHELAHQWFGNLVTMEWWTHLWLNEGFASFVEYLAIDHIFPDWDIWTQFVSSEMGDAYNLDSLKNTHPIEVEVKNPAEISEIFDKVSYAKGASVLRMLWKYLGEKDFQKGLQHYLQKYAYSNAKTEDLWACLEEVSGMPVAKVMKNWTSKPGHPVIRLQATGNRLQLIQNRFFSSPLSKRETKDNTIWAIPLKSQISNFKTQNYMLDRKTLKIDKPHSGWIKFNSDESSLVRIEYPYEYLKKLEGVVQDKKLSAPDRLGLIRDSFDLAQAGNSLTISALELVQSYVDEEDYTVWAEITSRLAQMDSLLAYEAFYPDFQSYGRKIYSKIVQKLGWERKSGEKHTDGLLRGMVLNMLGGFGDKDTIKMVQQLFTANVIASEAKQSSRLVSKIATDRQDDPRNDRVIDPDLKGVVYNLVAENGGDKEFNTLLKMYKDEDNQQEKDRIGRSLGKFKSKTLLLKTLGFSISKYVRFQNSLQIIAAVWVNPQGRYLAWDFVKAHWKLLKDRYAGGHYFTRVFTPAGSFTKLADAKDIEKFVAKNPVPEAKRTIAQALEQIYSNVDWLKRDKEKIKKFLS